MELCLHVNGDRREVDAPAALLLVDLLRDRLELTGTKVGCDTSQCGSCVVMLNGVSVKSCTVLAAQADGAEVQTVEGLAHGKELHPLQEGFWQEHGLQCGFCTPGMLMSALDLLEHHRPDPTSAEIREWLDGNFCRCTGYQNCVRAVQHAARMINSPVGMLADTPGKEFYERQVKYLMDKDIDSLVEKNYHDDACIVSYDGVVRGHDELKVHFGKVLGWLTIQRVTSTDKFSESDDTLMYEATVVSNHGVVRTFDNLLLEGGRIRWQFTGVR